RDVPSSCKLLHMSSLDAAKKVVDGSLDFVYLDADSDLASTIANITEWSKKVRKGGIIAGHDFFRYRARTNLHTRDGVLAYTSSYKIHPWFVIGLAIERVRSWFWVNV
ncbi:MAG: class I SAM-dependent methyltransferase, partial [Patescibacteria group bacterium]